MCAQASFSYRLTLCARGAVVRLMTLTWVTRLLLHPINILPVHAVCLSLLFFTLVRFSRPLTPFTSSTSTPTTSSVNEGDVFALKRTARLAVRRSSPLTVRVIPRKFHSTANQRATSDRMTLLSTSTASTTHAAPAVSFLLISLSCSSTT